MGVKGSDIRIAQERRHRGVADDRLARRVAEARRRALRRHRRRQPAGVAGRRQDWTNVIDKLPGLPKGTFVSEVVPSRFDEGDGLRDVRRPSPERLRDLHLRQHATSGRPGSSIDGEPEGRSRADADRGSEEPGRALPRHRDRALRVDRSRPQLAADQGEPADRPHRRDHAASARQRDDPRDARPRASGSSITSSRSRNTRRRRRRPRTRSCSRRRRPRCTGGRRAIATTSSGATRPSSARTRRRRRCISWLLKKQAGEVKLKITDAAGREVREISGPVLANSNKAGIQSACWDLRVQPVPAPACGAGRERRPGGGDRAAAADARAGGRGGQQTSRRIRSAPAAAVAAAVSAAAASASAAAAATPARTCCPASTTSSLIVDGKTIETKPLRVDGRSGSRRSPRSSASGCTTWRWRCTSCRSA